MFVVIGNPPYNMGQVNANDNNKNWKYETMDKRVQDTYSKDSKATNRNKLYDPYVKAIRWASDRICNEGVVAFVTNSGFLDGVAFDGMRKRLVEDFDTIYILDLGGNVRQNPKLSGTTHNVFGIQVGVSVNLLIKKTDSTGSQAPIFYAGIDEFWRKEDKYGYLNSQQHYQNVEWKQMTPDKRNTWLTEGLHAEFDTFIPMGTKQARTVKGEVADVIFKTYSIGINTSRDAWVYNFNRNVLVGNMSEMVQNYNSEVVRWEQRADRDANLDDFVVSDDKKIKWSRNLKRELKRNKIAEYAEYKVRKALYRPFTESYLFFDSVMNNDVSHFPSIFPAQETEKVNRTICVSSSRTNASFHTLMVDVIPDFHITGDSQCFPFYTYDEDGTNRKENITDWALEQFRNHYGDDTIAKWDIFHYNYGLLHHPDYREKYEANLRRDLPHIPYAKDFWGFANAGERLADIHANYESQPEYDRLRFIQNPDMPLDWRVEKMKLSRDKTQIVYNNFLTIEGIPAQAFEYRLGTRSALEWVIDQYRVKTDKRSGIVNDPNRADDPQYIVKLIGKVITVSLETVNIIENLPAF